MNKISYLLFISMFLFSITSSAQQLDVKHVSLNLKFDWAKKQAIGTAEISIRLLAANDAIVLDAGLLEIHSISMHNEILSYKYDGGDADDNLKIILNRKYSMGEELTIRIDYNTTYENRSDPNAIWGSFGKGLRFQNATSTTPNKRKQIWSSGEPANNKYWFPCNEDISDIHTTTIIATVDKSLMLIANGNLVETINNKDNTISYRYESLEPYPNYLVSICIGEYTDVKYNSGTTVIHNYGYPHEVEAIKATSKMLPSMLSLMEYKTGYTYPYKQYSQAVVQDYPFPGLIGQHSFSIMSDNYIDDLGVHEDFKYLWDGIAMQALANQWFGNLIMPKSWDDIWLNNAFAQYFADLYTLTNNSKAEYLTYVQAFEQNAVITDWINDNKHPIVTSHYNDLSSFTSDNYSKYRGALVLHMLQKEVGESNWWKAIRYYVNKNANHFVTTQNFQEAIETSTGKSYQWFFDQWIYKIGLPKFKVSQHYQTDSKTLTLTIKQVQSQENKSDYQQVDYFKGKFPIEIDSKLFTVELEAKAENVFSFKFNKAPTFINFNYENTWLCELEYEPSIDEYFNLLRSSKDYVAKQRALDHLSLTANDSNTNKLLFDKTMKAFQKEINSTYYWRYKTYAIASLRKIVKLPYDKTTLDLLLEIIRNKSSWLKTSAITTLGNTLDSQYENIYLKALSDKSDRVINAAAIALGKCKSSKAYEAFMRLDSQTSWKSQHKISALNGFEQLGDQRAATYALHCLEDIHSPRWYLATPVWDYPFAAVNTLIALGQTQAAYPILIKRLKESLNDNDLNDIFQNLQLINLLKNEKTIEMYDILETKYKNDATALEAVHNFKKQYLESVGQ